MQFSFFLLAAASLASGAVLRRANPTLTQDIPTKAKPDNTFSNGKPMLGSEIPTTAAVPPTNIYDARPIDLPFGRLYHGDMKFFRAGELNSPDGITDGWMGDPGVIDSANQSACGIPDNAFSISKVAIHPYFLKYADLSRYCMQDVCISFWNGKLAGKGQSDMILKVTDICSTDPTDPTHCAKPGDIKIDRTKAKIMEQIPGNEPLKSVKQVNGNQFKDGISAASSETWWFFTKCWADALVQPAYTENWFAQPPIPNNLDWSQQTEYQQYANNQKSYPQQNPPWPTYPNGAYNQTYVDVPITDWSPTDPDPEWCPIAGGKGWGKPTGSCAGGSNQGSAAQGNSSAASQPPGVAAAIKGLSSVSSSSTSTSSIPTSALSASTSATATSASASQSTFASSTDPLGVAPLSDGSASGSGTDKGTETLGDGEEEDDTCEL